jgi:hypothetical protein
MPRPVYGTQRIYANVETDGVEVRTLVAVPGQRISPHLEHLVPDDAKTTEAPRHVQLVEAATVATPTIAAGSTTRAAGGSAAPDSDLAEQLEQATARAAEAEAAAAETVRKAQSTIAEVKSEADAAVADAKGEAEAALARAEAAARIVGDPAELKGQALEAALKKAGLSTDGTADQQRARVAEFLAGKSQA